jgi:hypothetical protein
VILSRQVYHCQQANKLAGNVLRHLPKMKRFSSILVRCVGARIRPAGQYFTADPPNEASENLFKSDGHSALIQVRGRIKAGTDVFRNTHQRSDLLSQYDRHGRV